MKSVLLAPLLNSRLNFQDSVIERDSPRPDEENREIAEICEQP
jgi:hypothetical protein